MPITEWENRLTDELAKEIQRVYLHDDPATWESIVTHLAANRSDRTTKTLLNVAMAESAHMFFDNHSNPASAARWISVWREGPLRDESAYNEAIGFRTQEAVVGWINAKPNDRVRHLLKLPMEVRRIADEIIQSHEGG